MERGDGILELVVRNALDSLAAAVDAIDIAVADILRAPAIACRKRALVHPLTGRARCIVGEAILAQETAAPVRFELAAVVSCCPARAAVAALPSPAALRDLDPITDTGLRSAVGAGLGIKRAFAIFEEGRDRKNAGSGKSVSVRLDIGGRL